jgi:hypothetical protein
LAKRKPNIIILLIIGLVAILIISNMQTNQFKPTQVFMLLGGGDTQSGPQHVADTWMTWTITHTDGTVETRNSGITGVGVQFSLLDLTTIRSIKIQIPVQLATELPLGTLIMVRPSLSASLNSGSSISLEPSWWQPFTFMAGRDPVGTVQTYEFYVLLTGTMQSPGSETLDMRSQVAVLNVNQFTLNVVVPEAWDAFTQNYAGYGLFPTDHKTIPVAYSATIGVSLPLFSGTFTLALPTQTVSTCTGGICVQIQATTFTTTAPGVTATVSGVGTTFTLRPTYSSPNQLNLSCAFLPSWLSWLCAAGWLGLAWWIWVAIGFVALYLLLRRGSSGSVVVISSKQ